MPKNGNGRPMVRIENIYTTHLAIIEPTHTANHMHSHMHAQRALIYHEFGSPHIELDPVIFCCEEKYRLFDWDAMHI